MLTGRLGTIAIDPHRLDALRASLGLAVGERIRIAYVPGPGDIYGTFEQWKEGNFDGRVPVVAYSTQLYDLVDAIGAELLALSQKPVGEGGEAFRFVQVPKRGSKPNFFDYLSAKRERTTRMLPLVKAFAPHFIVFGDDTDFGGLRLYPGHVILSVHNSYWNADVEQPQGASRFRTWFQGLLMRHAVNGSVTTSPLCARQVERLMGGSQNVRPEMPQAKSAADIVSQPTYPDKPRLLYVGRVEANKGVFDLLRAAQSLRARHEDLKLTFVGDGGALDSLTLEASKAGPWVECLGRVGSEEVGVQINRASLLVCPTRREFNEGLALVCVEAHMRGKPSVLSSVVPAAEHIGDAGLIFTADDQDALTRAIEAAVLDPEQRSKMRRAAARDQSKYLDRSLSWGSQLFACFESASPKT